VVHCWASPADLCFSHPGFSARPVLSGLPRHVIRRKAVHGALSEQISSAIARVGGRHYLSLAQQGSQPAQAAHSSSDQDPFHAASDRRRSRVQQPA
jgi:hypothetical protein